MIIRAVFPANTESNDEWLKIFHLKINFEDESSYDF